MKTYFFKFSANDRPADLIFCVEADSLDKAKEKAHRHIINLFWCLGIKDVDYKIRLYTIHNPFFKTTTRSV